MATLELTGLRKSFGDTPVLHGVDLTLADGEMLAIVGASGCGKSTLLRLVAGLERPSAGRVRLDGRDITDLDPSARDIAKVFQGSAWAVSSPASRDNCRADSASVWRWVGRSYGRRSCSCSMNRCPTSMPDYGCRCAPKSAGCSAG